MSTYKIYILNNFSKFPGNTENLSKGFEGSSTSPKMLALAFYSGLWAFDGW